VNTLPDSSDFKDGFVAIESAWGVRNEQSSQLQLKNHRQPNWCDSFESFSVIYRVSQPFSVPIATCNNLMYFRHFQQLTFPQTASPLLFECSMKVHNLFPVTLLSWKIEIECDRGDEKWKRMQSTIVEAKEKILKTHTHTPSDKLKVTMGNSALFCSSHTSHNEAT
jgi:hypothetical protein